MQKKKRETMSDKIHLYAVNDTDEALDRQKAVEAALELIRTELEGCGEHQSSIEHHMEHLSAYADRIQEALKTRKK
jgi:predicted esterase YcpF (UPF0227 family)